MLRSFHFLGGMLRETGAALEKLGCATTGNMGAIDFLTRHRSVMTMYDKEPRVGKNVFVAPTAALQGDVNIGDGTSVWYGASVRGDANLVSIGRNSNIQDNAVIHCTNPRESAPTTVGNHVTVGHGAVLQQCTVEDEVIVGMGSRLMPGVYVEKHALIAAGAVVEKGTRVPAGQLWGGNPARFLRNLTDAERGTFGNHAKEYQSLSPSQIDRVFRASQHSGEVNKSWTEIVASRVQPYSVNDRDLEHEKKLGIVPDEVRKMW